MDVNSTKEIRAAEFGGRANAFVRWKTLIKLQEGIMKHILLNDG